MSAWNTWPRSASGHALFELSIKLIVEQDGRVLLLRRVGVASPFWDLPGGRVGLDEGAADAIARELREEIGHTAPVDLRLVDVELWRHRRACPKILHYYRARSAARVDVTLSAEHTRFEWAVPSAAALDTLAGARLEPTLRALLLRVGASS